MIYQYVWVNEEADTLAILQSVTIPVAHGALEGLLRSEEAPTPPRAVALLCHPDPRGGGTMHNKVVATAAKSLNAAGLPTLRFNFSGVGHSSGVFYERSVGPDGAEAAADVRAALDWLAEHYPEVPITLGGFSFGSWVGLPVGAGDVRVTRLIGLGVPVEAMTMASLKDCAKPKLIVQGDHDQYGSIEALNTWFAQVASPKQLQIITNADHFFTGQLDALAVAITSWALGA